MRLQDVTASGRAQVNNPVSASVYNAADQIAGLKGVAQANSAFNAEQARVQRDWTEQMTAKQMDFNDAESLSYLKGKEFSVDKIWFVEEFRQM